MRLDKLDLEGDHGFRGKRLQFLRGVEDELDGSPMALYTDEQGRVYALTPEQAAERDPRYAEAAPQPESV